MTPWASRARAFLLPPPLAPVATRKAGRRDVAVEASPIGAAAGAVVALDFDASNSRAHWGSMSVASSNTGTDTTASGDDDPDSASKPPASLCLAGVTGVALAMRDRRRVRDRLRTLDLRRCLPLPLALDDDDAWEPRRLRTTLRRLVRRRGDDFRGRAVGEMEKVGAGAGAATVGAALSLESLPASESDDSDPEDCACACSRTSFACMSRSSSYGVRACAFTECRRRRAGPLSDEDNATAASMAFSAVVSTRPSSEPTLLLKDTVRPWPPGDCGVRDARLAPVREAVELLLSRRTLLRTRAARNFCIPRMTWNATPLPFATSRSRYDRGVRGTPPPSVRGDGKKMLEAPLVVRGVSCERGDSCHGCR